MSSDESSPIRDGRAESEAGESFPVVGIGASAGGLEAISELLGGLPETTGMAWIVVQHLDPAHDSLLAEILAKKTPLPVAEATEGMAIEPDHVYVIPPNTNLTLTSAVLCLTGRESGPARHTPIDILLHSLAEDWGHNAIGVILSGTGSDGTLGLKAIKDAGGITVAQDPASARFAGMPTSAIDGGCVDFILPPGAIAEALTRIGRQPYLNRGAVEALVDEDHLKRIFRLLRGASGVDFTHYKRDTILRRLGRRMALHQVDAIAAYADFVEDHPDEKDALCQDLLIRVTGFFRDPETFEGLVRSVFPALLADRSPKEPLRIWVPGCASGEEAYSIAICLLEFLGERSINTPTQIFGTDVSEVAIDKARAGTYLDNGAVTSERLKRFFVKLDGHYQIARPVRDLCVFARQDVTRDPPFSRLDLVSCRNLLIYLDRALQRRVIPLFHYALKPQGFLVLGPAETIGQSSELFELVDRPHKIYRKLAVPGHLGLDWVAGERQVPAGPRERAIQVVPVDTDRWQREAERFLLARYAPACVVIDDNLKVLYFHGQTSRYLEHAGGAASLNLQKLARPGLLVALAPAIQAARTGGSPVRREGIPIAAEGESQVIDLEVIPLKVADTGTRCFLILFAGVSPRGGALQATGWRAHRWARWWMKAPRRGATAPETETDRRIHQLTRELEATRDYLQAISDEHEAAQEALKSAQEEVLSANEEFRSTNEELETAKEELQSTNEELVTTNDELRTRNGELNDLNEALTESRDYADGIIDTMWEPFLVLDGELRVMRANHAFYACFQTTPAETEHVFLSDLANRQWKIPRLRHLLEEVLPRDQSFRDYEVTQTFPTIGERTMRVNAQRLPGGRLRKEMILLTMDDLTARVQTEQSAIFAEKERYRITLASIGEGVITTNAAGGVEYMNAVAEQYTGWSGAEAQGLPLPRVFTVLDEHTREPIRNVAKIAMISGRTAGVGTHLQLVRRDGEEFSIDAVAAPLHDATGDTIIGMAISFRDVTAHRRLAQQLSHQATHDALTGLVNRGEFERRIKRVIESAEPQEAHALLYLDLDQFKLVNDTCGHTAGDELLRQVADILHTRMRTRDTLARLGGDEFGVLLEHCPVAEALRVANDLRRSVQEFRFAWQDQHFSLGVSIGLVSVAEAGDTLERVLSAADSACYTAKEHGRNRVHVYQPDDGEITQRHGDMQWVPRIQGALAEGRFRLYYQPIVALGPSDTDGQWGEILLRLFDEQGRLILPAAFLPAAERYDQMHALDRWVISTALSALRRQAQHCRYAINVSGQSLGNGELLEFVSEQLHGIEPGRICFEITETAAIANLRAAMVFMSTLKARGCRFALDDFGSGLSSFAYLKTLPVDHLKIDGRFIRNMRQDPIDRAMAESIHQIGHVMGLKTIAESVEDTATLEALRTIGVDYAQGFGIAEPRALALG